VRGEGEGWGEGVRVRGRIAVSEGIAMSTNARYLRVFMRYFTLFFFAYHYSKRDGYRKWLVETAEKSLVRYLIVRESCIENGKPKFPERIA
jgi:hypothetical protein